MLAGLIGKRDLADLPEASAPRRTIFPDKEGDERPGRALGIAIEEMQLCCVFEAGGLLDEPQAEEPGVEIDVRLHLAGNCRHVMYARNHREHSVLDRSGQERQN